MHKFNRACLALVAGLALGLSSVPAARAATIVEEGCGSYEWAEGPIGGGGSVSLDCTGVPGILASGGSYSDGPDRATHTHRAIYETGVGESRTFMQTITSSPVWNEDGFYLLALVDGFASFQGNPGDTFSYHVVVTATYAGVSPTATVSGVLDHTGNLAVFDSEGRNCPQCGTGGPFVSTMVTTISGPGEMHLQHTGVGEVTPVPEPTPAALWAAGAVMLALVCRGAGPSRLR